VIIVVLALIAIVGACGGLVGIFAKNFITLMTAMWTISKIALRQQ